MPEESLANWWIAYIVTGVVIALVVALVAGILEYARRIGKQALAITEELDEIRQRTMPLWDVYKVSQGLDKAAESLTRIREARGTW